MVTNPIDLLKIQQRMKTEEYDSVDDMVSDVELMVNNAQAYYKVRHYGTNFKLIFSIDNHVFFSAG